MPECTGPNTERGMKPALNLYELIERYCEQMNTRFKMGIATALWVLFAPSSALGAGARLAADLNPGAVGSYPSNLTAFLGQVYFSAYRLDTGVELWRSDGSSIALAANINPTADDIGTGTFEGNDSIPAWLTGFNGQLYFSAYDPMRGAELWRYDGSQAARVADLNPDPSDAVKLSPNNSWPRELTVLNDALFFSATSSTTPPNYELWKHDLTGTRRVANLHPDVDSNFSSYPTGLIGFNGNLYFMADDGSHGWELWRCNQVDTVLLDLNPGGSSSSSYPKYFTPFNNQLYFQAYTPANGFELWKTDGTSPALAADVNPGGESSYPEYLTVFNGALYFRGSDAAGGAELWKYNGTQASLAADLNASGSAYPKNLMVFGDRLVFAANDGVHGWELWKFDGATASLATDLNVSGDSFPENFTISNGVLYFTATTPETGYELWQYDGETVSLAADVNPGPADSFPRFLTSVAGKLFFSAADDGSSNWELWVLDPAAINQPPTASMTSPINDAAFTANETITITASATDDVGVARVEFFSDGQSLGNDTTAPYSVSVTLLPGTHSLTAVATDAAGRTGTSPPVRIVVNSVNQPPTVVLTAPNPPNTDFSASQTITIAASATDDAGIAAVEFYSNGSSLGSDTTAPYSIALNLPVGTHSLTAMATDTAGLTTTSESVTITVNPANQPPTVMLTSPTAPNTTFAANESITLTASATDDAGLDHVEFYSDGAPIGSDPTAPYAISLTLAVGSHSLTAVATDTAGLTSTSAPVTITVSPANQPPAVVLTAPKPQNTVFSADEMITVAADANDDTGVSRVHFYSDALPIGSLTAPPYSIALTLPVGRHSLTAVATDSAGLISTSPPVSITVNPPNQPPTIVLTAPANGTSFTSGEPVTITASASDDLSVSFVEFLIDGLSVRTASTAPYTISLTLNPGSHLLAARAVDAAGASRTSAPVNITVSEPITNPPQISSFSRVDGVTYLESDVSNDKRYLLERSDDLVNWTPVASNTANGGRVSFSYASGAPRDFFRLSAQ